MKSQKKFIKNPRFNKRKKVKKIICLSVVCASFLFAQTKDEILKQAMEFETSGDYKNAMLYYKKLALLDVSASVDYNEAFASSSKGLKQEVANTELNYYETYETQNKPSNLQIQNTPYPSTNTEPLYPRAESEDGQWIYLHRPTYFGYAYDFDDKEGRKNGETKFQISLQKPLFDDLLGLDETWSVAYTQTSFWQLGQDSAPFRATNYEPEVFVTAPTNFWGLDYLRVGLNHESNGRAGTESRSWNRAYLQTSFDIGNLRVTPRVWHSFTFDKDNKDIRQYLGYGDLRLDYDIKDHRLSALLRNNLRFNSENRGALELNWYFPLFKDMHGFVQYFTGYGESLEDYNHHVDKAMIGIAFIKK